MKKIISISLLYFFVSCSSNTEKTFSIDYEKYELENGLTVILHEDDSDPIVSVAIVYHVGSNRETPGRTGFAHLFEHMLFQESQHVGQDQFFKKIQNAGGTLNGGTSNDYTIYYEVVPNNALETVLWMESDRMGWLLSTVTQSAFENQQEVVQNEKRQRVDNRPYGHNNYVMIKNMYPENHPYNWTVIGELEDLQNATLEDVRSFYEKWYGPNNATMVIAGDIKPKDVKKIVKKYFGEIKKGPEITNPEPWHVELAETKKVYHEDNFARSPRITMAFPTVNQLDDDAPALELLAQLLGDGKKAPLYKVIVEERKLAPNVSSFNRSQEIAGAFNISSTAFPNTNLTDVEKAIFDAFEKFEIDKFKIEDLKRLKAKYETSFYSGISSILNKSFQLGLYNEYYGSPDYISRDLQRVLDVTEEDINRVYLKYIKDQNYVLSSFVPKGKTKLIAQGSKLFPVKEEKIVKNKKAKSSTDDSMVIEKIPSSFDRSIAPTDGPQPMLNLPSVWKYDLAKGIEMYGAVHDELPLISFGISLEGGMLMDDPNKIGVANLITDMMMEGTVNKTPVELEEAIDALGSSINMYTTKSSINIEAFTLKRNFEATLALIEEILFEPRWDNKEFDRIKRQTIEQIKRQSASPSAIASLTFNKLNYGDHILSNSTFGTVESVNSIMLDDLKNYYNSNFSSNLVKISIVGDISKNEAVKSINTLANKWDDKGVIIPQKPLPNPNREAKIYFVDVPNAKQSEIRIGYLSVPRTHPDYFANTVMNMKLGGNFSSDINLMLREEKGFTYGARSRFSGSKYSGIFVASSAVRTNTTEESMNIFKNLMLKYQTPIDEENLEFVKNVELKSNARRFETLNALRGMISEIATYDLPFDYIKNEENIVRDMNVDSHNELVKKYIKPNEMIYLVIGDKKTQFSGLKSLGFGNPIQIDREGKKIK